MAGQIDEHAQSAILSGKEQKLKVEALGGRAVDWVRAGLRVQIDGKKAFFTVLRVDRLRHLADLLGEAAVRTVETGVPLTVLRPAGEPDAITDVKASA